MSDSQRRRHRKLCKRILREAPFAVLNLAHFYNLLGFKALAQTLTRITQEGALRHARLVLCAKPAPSQTAPHYQRVIEQHERIIQARLERERAKENQPPTPKEGEP
jgi:hypothetical protein